MTIVFFPRTRRGPRVLRITLRLLLVAALATPAGAQIFKCTAAAGQVTYQNEPCPKSFKTDRVDIFDNSWTADRAEKDAQWQRQAAGHHVVAGMPLRWVREALGEPAEIRDTPTAGAKEVWLYNLPDRSVQVGILADQVLWSRETPVVALQARAAPEPAATDASGVVANAPRPVADAPRPVAAAPRLVADAQRTTADASHPAPDNSRAVSSATGAAADAPRLVADAPRTAADASDRAPDNFRAVPSAASAAADAPLPTPQVSRSAQVRISETAHGVARGQDCKQALAELGKPDRQRDVPAFDSASDPVTEYFYEPAGSENPTRIRIVCANGKVEGVDRSIVR